MNKLWGHLKTVTKHRSTVFVHCCRAGIPWQGFWHDSSKFSPEEFITSVRHYAGGVKSPNELERADYGYSRAWMHHKGRNKHHFEYWTDYDPKTHKMSPVPMPKKYLVEMFCDRVGACKVYKGKDYTDASAFEYFDRGGAKNKMHPDTARELERLLVMLRDEGEEKTFKYIRREFLKKSQDVESDEKS